MAIKKKEDEESGDSGTPGTQGAPGPQGIQGVQGATGPAGTYTKGNGIDISSNIISAIPQFKNSIKFDGYSRTDDYTVKFKYILFIDNCSSFDVSFYRVQNNGPVSIGVILECLDLISMVQKTTILELRKVLLVILVIVEV